MFYDVCWRCHGMHQDDRERGLRAFSLTHWQTGVFACDSEDVRELDEGMTRPLSMQTFGKFCALDKAGRDKHFADMEQRRQRQQQQEGDSSGGPPYYLHLEKHLDEHHWKTGNIDQLVSSQRTCPANARSMPLPARGGALPWTLGWPHTAWGLGRP